MNRRKLITHSSAAVVGAAALGSCRDRRSTGPTPTIVTQPVVQWQMATSWPKSLQILFDSAAAFCQQVGKLTDGRFVITPYPAGELVGGLEVLSAVQANTVPCGHTASYYYLDQSNALAFGTSMPFGLNATQQNAWLYAGGGIETMQEIYAKLGVINFPGGNTGGQMGGWFKRQVNQAADFAGLNMRVPGLGGKILERLGATIHNLAGDQIFSALELGEIDAAEWKNPHADETLGLNRVAPYYYYPGWWEPGTSYEFQVNLEAWQQLPHEYKEAFKSAATDTNGAMLDQFNAVNGPVLKRLLLSGTELLPFSQDILAACYRAALELYEEIASQDREFERVYRSWQAFRSNVSRWNRINEISFASFVMGEGITGERGGKR